MLRELVWVDWVWAMSMSAAVWWLFSRRQMFGTVAVAVGSVAMASLALVVGLLAFFSVRAVGAVVAVAVFCTVCDVGKAVYARLSR